MTDDGPNASKEENFRIKSLDVYATRSTLHTVIGTISRAHADILEKRKYIIKSKRKDGRGEKSYLITP